jgi:O-methyltransferase
VSLELAVKRAFASLGLQVQRLPTAVWESDERFQRLLRDAAGVTLLDPLRFYMLYQAALLVKHLPGDALEIGVYRGGTARLLGHVLAGAGKTLHLFDTFAGMPAVDPRKDTVKEGLFSDSSLELVKANLAGIPGVVYHPGLFPDTAGPVEDSRFCLAHVDVDIHRSIADACAFVYPRLERGGVMVFDDYGSPACPGVKPAVDEFCAQSQERPFYLPTGQCLVFKTR